MKHRLQLRRPEAAHQFKIRNGSATKDFMWWEFQPDYETLCQLHDWHPQVSVRPKLAEILSAVGSHATLWIGEWMGTVAPMDVEPQGWTYPNGSPLEPEWWWQWFPSASAGEEISQRLNCTEPFSSDSGPLKAGVPFQMQRSQGETQDVRAIAIQRLPNLVRKESLWLFEFERGRPDSDS